MVCFEVGVFMTIIIGPFIFSDGEREVIAGPRDGANMQAHSFRVWLSTTGSSMLIHGAMVVSNFPFVFRSLFYRRQLESMSQSAPTSSSACLSDISSPRPPQGP